MFKLMILPALAVAMLGLSQVAQEASSTPATEGIAVPPATTKPATTKLAASKPIPKAIVTTPVFFSSDQLASDHPFRRLQALRALQGTANKQMELWSSRSRIIRDQERKARQLAKKAEKGLREKIEKQFKAHMKMLGQRLLAHVDERLAAKKFSKLIELQLVFAKLPDIDKLMSIHNLVTEIKTQMKSELAEKRSKNNRRGRRSRRSKTKPKTDRAQRRWQERKQRLGHEMRNLFGERIAEA